MAEKQPPPQPAPVITPVTTAAATTESRFVMHSPEEEAAFDIVAERNLAHPLGKFQSILNLVKGALGSGILGGHVAYMKAGFLVALVSNGLLGAYVAYCLYTVVTSAQILCKRTKIHTMSYPDVGEAAFALSGNPNAKKCSKCFRYLIDICIGFELFGACSSYQIIMSKSIKQLVEQTQSTTIQGIRPGYPPLQLYTALIWIPCVLLSLVNRFSLLAKISLVGNFIVLLCMFSTMYYCSVFNPTLSNLKPFGTAAGFFELCGVSTFSMSCVGAILPVENHLRNTYDYKFVHFTSFLSIIGMVMLSSLFGYAAFLENSEAPITVNFPMEIYPMVLKVFIVLMVLTTHALNFWIPFQLVWFYAKKRHANSKRIWLWEFMYKIIIITGITAIAILFPDVTAVMGFLGTLMLSNLIFVFPNLIEICVYMPRPGYGRNKWRLYKCIVLISLGIGICISGSYFTGLRLILVFQKALA